MKQWCSGQGLKKGLHIEKQKEKENLKRAES